MVTYNTTSIQERFRGYLPIVIDVETGGLEPQTDALLEIAAYFVDFDHQGELVIEQHFHEHVAPFFGAHMSREALAFNKIDPDHPFRFALSENEVLKKLFQLVRKKLKQTDCKRAVLVGHNAWFDLSFLNAAIARNQLISPFHRFTSIDTATLAALCVGETVLRSALLAAGLHFNEAEAHSALYDAERTAAFFCYCVNRYRELTMNHY